MCWPLVDVCCLIINECSLLLQRTYQPKSMQQLSTWAHGWDSLYISCSLIVTQKSNFRKYLVNIGLSFPVRIKKVKDISHIRNDLVVESRETQLKTDIKKSRIRTQGQPRIIVRLLNVVCSDQTWSVLILLTEMDHMLNTK